MKLNGNDNKTEKRGARFEMGTMPPAPIADLLGFSLVSMKYGEVIIEFEAGPQHANPMGTLHGGVLCDLADLSMGAVYATTLGEGESFTTLELKINFLKPFWTGKLRAVAGLVKRGKTVGMVECEIFDTNESLVAKVSSTCMTLKGNKANGR
ncbi:MAG: PaaI family thioesterase [Desulfomonilaceae bacterium]